MITDNPTIIHESGAGACDGQITVNASGGTAPYTYSIDGGSTYQAGNVFSGLCNGIYQVCIKDANACVMCYTYTIVTLNCSSMTSVATTNPASCNGACDGIAIIFTTGGVGPYIIDVGGNQYTSTGMVNTPVEVY